MSTANCLSVRLGTRSARAVTASLSLVCGSFRVDDRQPPWIKLERRANRRIEQPRAPDRLAAELAPNSVGGLGRTAAFVVAAGALEQRHLLLLGKAARRNAEESDALAPNFSSRQLNGRPPDHLAHVGRLS